MSGARDCAGKPDQRLVLLFAVLYFAEGAPIGLIWWGLPTILRTAGVEVSSISALSASLVLPWTLKFLWAPLVDALRGPRWNRRHWIIAAQTGMGLALVPLVFIDPARHYAWWAGLLLVHAFFAATQDVGIDALAVETVPADSRGWVNGAMQAGMLLGRSLFGGVSIVVAARWGFAAVVVPLIAVIWGTLAFVRFSSLVSPGGGRNAAEDAGQGHARRVLESLKRMVKRRSTWYGVFFALVGGAGYEAAGGLAGPYLVDHGVSGDAVGVFFSLPTVAAMLVGGLIGGRVSDRIGRVRSVTVFLLWTAGCVMALALLPAGFGAVARFGVLIALYLGIGLFTASSYALFMDLSDPEAGGTQFSAFMAATNACEAWAVWTAGQVVERSGYGPAFGLLASVSAVAVFVLVPLGRGRARI
ncbi:MAG: MFS transporter [Verrucomicrobia bacterium]|nr:MAG: MFS transporter [Verrucomicrobiota bacterium]